MAPSARGPSIRAILLGGLLLPILLGAGPCGPISGGRLAGTPAAEWPRDWSFTNELSTIQIETRPLDPLSVTTWCFTDGPTLYVPSRGAAGKQWVKNAIAMPKIRLRIGDQLYRGELLRVTESGEIRRIVALLRKKYTLARWFGRGDPVEDRDTWYFQVQP